MKTSGNSFKGMVMAILVTISMMAFSQQAGWHWQNPYLQGNDLNSIIMNGSIGWAVGDLGTVMHTTNSGFDWEIIDLHTSENLNCIYMAGVAGKGWIVGSNGTIFYSEDDGVSWVKQYSGTHAQLNSVSATLGECPWICGDDIILKSYNHGETWERVNCIYHSTYYAIDQVECDEIWISGKQGLLISSHDTGLTWESHATPTIYNFYSVDLVGNGDYRACGHQAVIIRSSDGGNTWVKENEITFKDMYDVDTRGIGGPAYAVGSDGIIVETTNGGETWIRKESPTVNALNDVCFHALTHDVYATGWYGTIVRKEEPVTAEFEVMNERPIHLMQSVDFATADSGWAVGWAKLDLSGKKEGVILGTSDGGTTWEKQLTIPDPIGGLDFISSSEGWATGSNGVIKHTVNGGKTWTTQSGPLTGYLNAVHFIDKNNGWIVSSDNWGEIAHTSNGGNTWERQTAPTKNPLYDVFFINADKGWIVGMDSTLLRTTDGGQTWLRCDLEVTNNWLLRSIFFIDEMRGWTVGIYGIIMITKDGGITWQEIHTGFSETLTSVYFIDPTNGWATGFDGTIFRSIDGGYTWFKQYSGVYRNIMISVHFINLLEGWVTGEGGTIKRTQNGGFWNEPGTFQRNKLKLLIHDLTETRDTLTVDSSDMIQRGYQLVGLEVMIDSIMHTRASDLDISLYHNGVSLTLVSQVTGQGPDFLWTRLTDDAAKLVTDGVAPFSGNHKPCQPLSAYNGLDPVGDWVLTIYDSKTGNTGTLKAWGIKPYFEKIVSIDEPISPGGEYKIRLAQNSPNPFTGSTKISWNSEICGFTTLKVFNINGQEIVILKNEFLPRGEYNVAFDATRFSAGVYYYQLVIGNERLTKKCIVMK